jgi:hypothetical protein
LLLGLAVLGTVLFWVPLVGIALTFTAYLLSGEDLRQMRNGEMDPAGLGLTIGARILARLGGGLGVFVTVLGCLVVLGSLPH